MSALNLQWSRHFRRSCESTMAIRSLQLPSLQTWSMPSLLVSDRDRFILAIRKKVFQIVLLTQTYVYHFVLKTKILRNSGSRASTIFTRTGPESTPHDLLALVANMSEPETSEEEGVDLQMLQSLIKRLQRSDTVCPFNAFPFFWWHSIVRKSVLSTKCYRE